MKSLPPLLFVSGWGASSEMWSSTLAHLPGGDARCLSWRDDLDDRPSALSRALLTATEPLVLVGWSLGALLALRAAHQLLEKVAALVLVSAMPCLTYGTGERDGTARMLKTMRLRLGRNAASVLQDFARQCLAPDGDAAMQQQFLQQAQAYTPGELAAGLACLGSLDLTQQLGGIASPCTLLHGAQDRIVPPDSARSLAAALPHAQLSVFEERGHALPFTIPHEIARQIQSLVR